MRLFSYPVLSEVTQSLMRMMNLLFFLFKYSHSVSYLRYIIFIPVAWSINLNSYVNTPSSTEYLAVGASKNFLLFIKCLLSNILEWRSYFPHLFSNLVLLYGVVQKKSKVILADNYYLSPLSWHNSGSFPWKLNHSKSPQNSNTTEFSKTCE